MPCFRRGYRQGVPHHAVDYECMWPGSPGIRTPWRGWRWSVARANTALVVALCRLIGVLPHSLCLHVLQETTLSIGTAPLRNGAPVLWLRQSVDADSPNLSLYSMPLPTDGLLPYLKAPMSKTCRRARTYWWIGRDWSISLLKRGLLYTHIVQGLYEGEKKASGSYSH